MLDDPRLPLFVGGGLLLLIAVSAVAVRLGYEHHDEREDHLREVFHLPADAEMEFHIGGNYRFGNEQWVGIVDFTSAQFYAYEHELDDWEPTPFTIRGIDVPGPSRDGAIHWQRGDAGAFEGCHWVDWGILNRAGVYDIEHGDLRSICYVAVESHGDLELRPCRDANDAARAVVVRGALDVRRKRLYALVKR